MTGDWRGALLNSKGLWLVAVALLAVPLLAGFNERLSMSRQLFEEESRLQHQIEVERARLEFLQQYQTLVNSDAYVEWWARVQARMTRPGEVAVVPESPASQVASGMASGTFALARDPAGEWWAVFFASVP